MDSLYTKDGLPVVSQETLEALIHDIKELPTGKLDALLIKYATEIHEENPCLSRVVSSLLITGNQDPDRQALEIVIITYKLLKSQMQNNKIIEMLK